MLTCVCQEEKEALWIVTAAQLVSSSTLSQNNLSSLGRDNYFFSDMEHFVD